MELDKLRDLKKRIKQLIKTQQNVLVAYFQNELECDKVYHEDCIQHIDDILGIIEEKEDAWF